jgi:AbrB family looped-hinge helix DNA binding protein
MEVVFMSVATKTSKGQTTIPKEIRDALHLQPRDQIQFNLMSDGVVIMRAKKRSISDMFGILHDSDRKPVTLDEMKSWR